MTLKDFLVYTMLLTMLVTVVTGCDPAEKSGNSLDEVRATDFVTSAEEDTGMTETESENKEEKKKEEEDATSSR